MKRFMLMLLITLGISFSQDPFQNLESAVGYIVIEKQGKAENYIVVQGKDGSVKTIKVDKNPSKFLKKEEGKGGRQ
ncbi:MAG: hypothetical protein ACK4VK_07920 [Aquificaceae bacterium]